MQDMPAREIPIEIAPDQLSEEAMAGVIENFILREGTDYGVHEFSYDAKAAQIRRQIDRKEVRIVYDLSSETVSLLSDREFRRLVQEHGNRSSPHQEVEPAPSFDLDCN